MFEKSFMDSKDKNFLDLDNTTLFPPPFCSKKQFMKKQFCNKYSYFVINMNIE